MFAQAIYKDSIKSGIRKHNQQRPAQVLARRQVLLFQSTPVAFWCSRQQATQLNMQICSVVTLTGLMASEAARTQVCMHVAPLPQALRPLGSLVQLTAAARLTVAMYAMRLCT